MSYITQTVDEFFVKLDKMQGELNKFSQTLDSRSDKIPKLLENFKTTIFQPTSNMKKVGTNAVEKATQQSLENLRAVIETWNEDIERDRKGKEFIKKNEKFLVVMVFGAVKVGKSSLGNFFAGKKFFNAPFDNHYKKISKPQFATEERGRDTGDIEKDLSGDTWFSEGVTDTTGAIQYFTLSGLRWIDSPGTGALAKKGDTKDMTALVEEYLSYTDMCIFLMNSSEPGLQSDMKYMSKLDKEGQESLIIITRSDNVEEDVDDEGKMIEIHVPKSPENRKLQEDDVCTRVVDNRAMEILLENYRKNHPEVESEIKNYVKNDLERQKKNNLENPMIMSDIKALGKILREKLKEEMSKGSSANVEEVLREKLKSEMSHTLQEDLKKYLQSFRTKFRAVSISTLLANEAIEAEDDEKFKVSNLDKLMKILGDKVSDNVIARKQENPRKILNNFVDTILGKSDTPTASEKKNPTLKDFEADIDKIISTVEKYKSDMDRMTDLIVSNVRREVRREISYKANEWNRQARNGKSVGSDIISAEVSKILKEKLNEEINSQMRRVIEDFQSTEMQTVKANISVAELKKKTAQIEHTYTKTYTVTREPKGIIENVRSWFGKQYYTTERSTQKEYQTVDVGTNIDEFLESLMPQVENYAKEQANENLARLRDNYFIERETFAKNMRNEISKLRAELQALKF